MRKIRTRSILRLTFAATLLVHFPTLAFSQTVVAPRMDRATIRARLAKTMAPPGRAMPSDAAELDSMIAHKEFIRLSNRLRAANTVDAIFLDMNWEQSGIYNGASFVTGYAYMYDMWRVGSVLPPSQGEEIKESAAMMFLYNFSVISLDGDKCADVSAPGHRLEQLLGQNKSLVQYLASLPVASRMELGTISLNIELATAPLRTNDDVLCSGGLAQVTHDLKAQGDKPLPQIPSAPGMFGKTYGLPPAPGYKPQFVGADIWRPKQDRDREALPAALTSFLATLDNLKATSPSK